MRQRLLILGVIAAIAALSAVKSFGPDRAASSSCCPGLPPVHESLTAPKPGGSGAPDAIPSGKPVWVLAHSDWCAQCQEMSKIAGKVAPAFAGQVEFLELKVDDPRRQDLVRELNVSVIPTSIFLDSRGREVDRVLGVIPEPELKRRLQSLSEER